MPTSQIKWGAGLAKTLVFQFPLFSVVTDRRERSGSEHVVSPGGVRDAWIVGRDYVMDCEARFLLDASGTYTPVSGADSWQDFLDWCRNAGSFRFIPDVNTPAIFIDPCYLDEPMKDFGTLGRDLKRVVKLRLSNPTYDFHKALVAGVLYTGP